MANKSKTLGLGKNAKTSKIAKPFGLMSGGKKLGVQKQTMAGKTVPVEAVTNRPITNTKPDHSRIMSGGPSGLPNATPPHASHAEKNRNRYAK